MSQSSRGFGFTSKARYELLVSGELRLNNLDGYGPPGPKVCCAIDSAHSSLSEELLDLIFIVEYFHLEPQKSTKSTKAQKCEERLCFVLL